MSEYEILKTCQNIAILTGANMGAVRSIYRKFSKYEPDHKKTQERTLEYFKQKKDGMQ